MTSSFSVASTVVIQSHHRLAAASPNQSTNRFSFAKQGLGTQISINPSPTSSLQPPATDMRNSQGLCFAVIQGDTSNYDAANSAASGIEMEGLLNPDPQYGCSKPFTCFNSKTASSIYMRPRFLTQKLELGFERKFCINSLKNDSALTTNDNVEDVKDVSDWETEFLGELDPYGYRAPKPRKKQSKSKLVEDSEGMDWCVMRGQRVLGSGGAGVEEAS